MEEYLGKIVHVVMDRPLDSLHPKHGFRYEVNYGYVPDTVSGDGEEIDAYILGVDVPLKEYEGKCVAIIRRQEEDDDKLVIIPSGMGDITDAEIIKATHFQEKPYHIEIIRPDRIAK